MGEHARGLAAEEQAAEAAAPVRSHGDGIALFRARDAQDALPGLVVGGHRRGAAHPRCPRFGLDHAERPRRLLLHHPVVLLEGDFGYVHRGEKNVLEHDTRSRALSPKARAA